MKRFPDSLSKILARGLAAIVLGSLSLVSIAGTDGDAIVQTTASGVSYVSGGVGTASIDRINSLAGGFNLKLVFAGASGAYLADVRVIIADSKGRTLVDTLSDGPWFLAKLPRDDYRIVASYAGNDLRQRVSIGTQKLRTVQFRWASE